MKNVKHDNTASSLKLRTPTVKGTLPFTRASAQPKLASEADILACFQHDLRARGFAGEVNTATVLFLVLSSRVLKCPVSAAVKGESAGGKSYVVDNVVTFFPKRAYLQMTAASDKSLFHLEKSLRHRVLIFGEKHGMASDMLNYYVRELLSSGFIEQYSVRPAKGGHATKHLKTKGPTNFITTTTSDLHPENETRLLALHIDESREATAQIMVAVARSHDGTQTKESLKYDPVAWTEFQVWLAKQDSKVEIPFAQPLARLIDPTSIRLRRDFGKLLNLISIHALLHRKTRKVGPNGIVAEIRDYRAVWKLMRKVFALSMEQSVDPIVRQTVDAVRDLGSVTVTLEVLAKALGIDKSNATRRYQKAEAAGLLMNRGAGAGRPYAIAIAASMPSDDVVLPTPKALRRAMQTAGKSSKV